MPLTPEEAAAVEQLTLTVQFMKEQISSFHGELAAYKEMALELMSTAPTETVAAALAKLESPEILRGADDPLFLEGLQQALAMLRHASAQTGSR